MNKLLTVALSFITLISSAQDFDLVQELLLEGETLKAKSKIQNIIEDHPENAEAFYWLGSALSQEVSSKELNPQGDIKLMVDAGVSFEKAKFLNFGCLKSTDNGRALKVYSSKTYNLGISSYKKGNIEMALTHFKMVVMSNEWLQKEDVDALYYTGHCANKLNNPEVAKTYLEKAMAVHPENMKIARELVKAKIDLNELADASSVIKKSLAHNPTDKSLWQDLVAVSLKAENHEEALSASQTLSHLDSSNSANMAILASMYDKVGKKEKALDTYMECVIIEQNPVS